MKRTFSIVFIVCLVLGTVVNAHEETRGVWLNKAQLLKGEEYLDEFFKQIRQANLNAVYINTCFQGYVIYPDSEYLPVHPDYTDKDYLSVALHLAQKHGLKTYAWMEYGFYGYHNLDIPSAESLGPLFDRHLDWISIDKAGSYFIHNPQWGDYLPINPVIPEAQNFLIGIFTEVMKRYPFDGIDYDRIRFGTQNHCYSEITRILFLRDTGIDIHLMENNSREEQIFIKWKKAQLNAFVERLSFKLREVRPDIYINAAVVPPYRIDELAQDWPAWAEHGWVDSLSPMLYYREIDGEVRKAISLTPEDYPFFYGLDTGGNPPEVIVRQVNELRQLGAKGFVFWYAGTIGDHLEMMKKHLFSESVPPFSARRSPRDYEVPCFDQGDKVDDVEAQKTKEPGQN